jgi:predicted transcriptional regulator
MKKRMNYVFDDNDEKAVQLFTDLGMPRNLAKTLMYLCQIEECHSADIEHGADLRQPEVSVAMQELRKRGWVKKRDLKKEGKGRPTHLYKPTSTLTQILKTFEEEKLQELQNFKNDMQELKQLVKTK